MFTKYLPYLKTAGIVLVLAFVGYLFIDSIEDLIKGIIGLVGGLFGWQLYQNKSKPEILADEHKDAGNAAYVESLAKQKDAEKSHDEALESAKNETEITPVPGYHRRKSSSR